MAKRTQKPPNPDLLARLFNDMSLAWRLIFDRRVSGGAKMIPLAMIVYILSPIDLIPDILLPFGIVDDLTAFLLGLQLFIRSAPPGVVDEYRAGKPKRRENIAAQHGDHPQIIEGQYEVHDDRD